MAEWILLLLTITMIGMVALFGQFWRHYRRQAPQHKADAKTAKYLSDSLNTPLLEQTRNPGDLANPEAKSPPTESSHRTRSHSLYRPTERLPQGDVIPSCELVVLVVAGEVIPNQVAPILKSPFVIGRKNADLNLNDDLISREHARLIFDPVHAKFFLLDSASTNGTLVNGEQAQPTKGIPLRDGAEIRIGLRSWVQFRMKQ